MKKLICILLILMLFVMSAGCSADREETYSEEVGHDAEKTGDPGPPWSCDFETLENYFAFYDALQDPNAVIKDVFEKNTSDSSDVSDRETAEMICDLVERAPYPTLAGEDLRVFKVLWRNNGTAEVDYSISWGDDHILLIFYPVDAEESTGEEMRIKINKSSNHPEKKEIRYFGAEVDGVPLRVVMSADKEEQAIEVLERIEFKRISELREEYQKEQRTKREETPLYGVTAEEIEWVKYADGSVADGDYVCEYTDKDEIARILEMFAELEPISERIEEEEAPGNFCIYTVLMNDGTEEQIVRSGSTVTWEDRFYTGSLGWVAQKNDAELYLDKSFYEKHEWPIVDLKISVFDPVNTQIVFPLTFQYMDQKENKWIELERGYEQEEWTVSVSEADLKFNLEFEARCVGETGEFELCPGDYRVKVKVIMPTGEERILSRIITVGT